MPEIQQGTRPKFSWGSSFQKCQSEAKGWTQLHGGLIGCVLKGKAINVRWAPLRGLQSDCPRHPHKQVLSYNKSEMLVPINPGFDTGAPIQLVKNTEILIHCRRQYLQPGVYKITYLPWWWWTFSCVSGMFVCVSGTVQLQAWHHPETSCVTGVWTWLEVTTDWKEETQHHTVPGCLSKTCKFIYHLHLFY